MQTCEHYKGKTCLVTIFTMRVFTSDFGRDTRVTWWNSYQ